MVVYSDGIIPLGKIFAGPTYVGPGGQLPNVKELEEALRGVPYLPLAEQLAARANILHLTPENSALANTVMDEIRGDLDRVQGISKYKEIMSINRYTQGDFRHELLRSAFEALTPGNNRRYRHFIGCLGNDIDEIVTAFRYSSNINADYREKMKILLSEVRAETDRLDKVRRQHSP